MTGFVAAAARGFAVFFLVLNGLAHLGVGFLEHGAPDRPAIAVFGAIYFGLGVMLCLPGGRRRMKWAAILPAVGGTIGGVKYAITGGSQMIPVFLALDVVTIIAAVLYIALARRGAAGPA